MRIVVLIDEGVVIERILRHLGLWEEGVRLHPARAPPGGEGTVELFPGDPFPDYSMDAVFDCDVCPDACTFAAVEVCLKQTGFFRIGRRSCMCGACPAHAGPRLDKTHEATTPLLHETAIRNDLLGRVPQSLKSEFLSIFESDPSHHQTKILILNKTRMPIAQPKPTKRVMRSHKWESP